MEATLQLDTPAAARPRAWAPVLAGAPAEQARATVVAIAEALCDHPAGIEGGSLAGGYAGLALFYSYLARAGAWPGAEQVAEAYLDAAIDTLASERLPASLYGGFSGIAWAAGHILGPTAAADDDASAEIDEALLAHLGATPWRRDYDLIGGLVGYGVYALEQLPSPRAAEVLAQVVARLAETAERQPAGATWWTAPHLLIPSTRAEFPNGYYNLGLAHGVPGVIALLAGACAAGVADGIARPLLGDAVSWLLAQRLPPNDRSLFGYYAGPGVAPQTSRLAWCYGDLGLAAALLYAARAVAEPAWERGALEVARHAAARSPHMAGVADAGLCHGSAGAAHIFNRLYQATGEEAFANAARRWFAQTFELRRPGQGLAGYLALEPVRGTTTLEWAATPGLLCGVAGVGLALLAATSAVEPGWDRMLLVAIPPK